MRFALLFLRLLRILVLVLAYINLVSLAVNRFISIINATSKQDVQVDWQDWAEIAVSLILAIASLYAVIVPSTIWDARLKYPRATMRALMVIVLLYVNSNIIRVQVEKSKVSTYQQNYGSPNPFVCGTANGNRAQCYSFWICVFLSAFLGVLLVPELCLTFWTAEESRMSQFKN